MTASKRPSAAQRRVLERMGAGEKLIHDPCKHWYFEGAGSVHGGVANSLKFAGWIIDKTGRGYPAHWARPYTLTDLGRSHLESPK